MRYFIVSQNLIKGHMKLPKDTILRVNLAWHKSLASIRTMLRKYARYSIFLDIPVNRRKPPNHKHDVDEIARIARKFPNVKYVAVSNVESAVDLDYYCRQFDCKIVPKIETLKGVEHAQEIIDSLNYKPQILMLDHEDLFSNLVSLKKEHIYLDLVGRLVDICKRKKAHLLRVKGIIFSSS